jgi:hypothetical protein
MANTAIYNQQDELKMWTQKLSINHVNQLSKHLLPNVW